MNYYEWMLTWNTVLAISTAVMVLAIGATVIYAWLTVRHNKKARYSDLLMRLHQIWDSKAYIQSRRMVNQYCSGTTPEEECQNLKEAIVTFDETDAEEFYIIVRISNFFENLGFLGRKEYIIREDALELFGAAARYYWNYFSATAQYLRFEAVKKQPDAWIYFEDFASGFPNEKERLQKIKAFFQRYLGKLP